jgi:hypothetical protein
MFIMQTIRFLGHTAHVRRARYIWTYYDFLTDACCRKQEYEECKTGHSDQKLKEKRAYNRNIC